MSDSKEKQAVLQTESKKDNVKEKEGESLSAISETSAKAKTALTETVANIEEGAKVVGKKVSIVSADLFDWFKKGASRAYQTGAKAVDDISHAPATEKLVEKSKQLGSEGLDATKEAIKNISEKASDISTTARLKYEISALTKNFDAEYLTLGKIAAEMHRNHQLDVNNEDFQNQLQNIEDLDRELSQKQQAYEALRKTQSDHYVVDKLSEDLESANATIDRIVISENSNVTGKLLKEIVLPKEALISTIKRENEIIICLLYTSPSPRD